MKNTGKCPKCGGTEIIEVPGGANGNYSWVRTSYWGQVMLKRFACGACGYSEEWINSPEDMRKVTDAYPPKQRPDTQDTGV